MDKVNSTKSLALTSASALGIATKAAAMRATNKKLLVPKLPLTNQTPTALMRANKVGTRLELMLSSWWVGAGVLVEERVGLEVVFLTSFLTSTLVTEVKLEFFFSF